MIILEGNIGAGKSTFLRLLSEQIPTLRVRQEPVNNWQRQVYGQSLLTSFYQDPKRWAYTFETLTMICRVQEHLIEQQSAHITDVVIERSIYSGFYCFAKNSFMSGFLSSLEWQLYQEWFAMLTHEKCMKPRGFIYLSVDPEIAYERIKKRNRYAEKTLSLGYLKQIHARHQEFLLAKQGIAPALADIPVLVLDCNDEFEADAATFNKHVSAVQDFFDTGFLPIASSPRGPSEASANK